MMSSIFMRSQEIIQKCTRECDIQIKRIYQLVICCFILTTIYLVVYLIPSQGIKENPDLEDNVVDELDVQDKIKEGLNADVLDSGSKINFVYRFYGFCRLFWLFFQFYP